MSAMMKMLMAGVAALSIASTAHATDVLLSLTDPLIGHWCIVKDGDPDVYRRGAWDCSGNLAIRHDGYEHFDHGSMVCTFIEVKRLSSKDGYVTRAECLRDQASVPTIDDPDNNSSRSISTFRNVEFRIANKMLRYSVLGSFEAQACAIVGEDMSDGFLNLRSGPGTKHDVKARLVTQDGLRINNKNGEWLRVDVPRLGVSGWVSERYVTRVSCERLIGRL